MILICISFLSISTLLIIRLVVHSSHNKPQPAIRKFFKLCLLSIIFALASVISDFLHIYWGFTIPKPLHQDTFPYTRAVADTTMFTWLLLFYFLPQCYSTLLLSLWCCSIGMILNTLNA